MGVSIVFPLQATLITHQQQGTANLGAASALIMHPYLISRAPTVHVPAVGRITEIATLHHRRSFTLGVR